MNKTVTINISGIVFHIEEDAYSRLKIYLDTLHSKFYNEEGRDEILADIESRIAEILTAKKGPNREVIVLKDVEEVISVMGDPEVISEDNTSQENPKAQAESDNYERRRRRRLFRDADDKVIGGVCSGLGHYFDVDTVWIRLGFALLFFLGGTGVLFYILLMIIIPRAETTAEKLEMRGDPVDVNNIHRSIKEEMNEFGERMKGFGKEAKDWGKHTSDNIRNRSRYPRRGAEDFLYKIFHVLGRIFAFCLVFFGIIMLVGLLTSTFTITDLGPDAIRNQIRSLFEDGTSYAIGITAFLLFFGIPVLMMIYSGVRMLFRIKTNGRVVGFSALGLWIIGVALGVISITHIAKGFSEQSEKSERVVITNAGMDTLIVRVDVDPTMINDDFDSHWNRKHGYERRWRLFSTDETTIKFGYAGLNIVPATGDSLEMVIYKKSNGRTEKEAQDRCNQIAYAITQNGNEFVFSSAFTIGTNKTWKGQELDAELRLPIGTVIYLDATCEDLIYNVKNTTDTFDDDMVDRRWRMTKQGLECVDCAGLQISNGKNPIRPTVQLDTIIHPADTIIIKKY